MLLSVLLESIVTATVEVTVRVTSQDFSEELNDQESKEFKDFNKTFSEQVTPPIPPHQHHPEESGGRLKMATELLNVCASQLARAGGGWEARLAWELQEGTRTGLVSGEGTLYLISGLLAVGMRTGEY